MVVGPSAEVEVVGPASVVEVDEPELVEVDVDDEEDVDDEDDEDDDDPDNTVVEPGADVEAEVEVEELVLAVVSTPVLEVSLDVGVVPATVDLVSEVWARAGVPGRITVRDTAATAAQTRRRAGARPAARECSVRRGRGDGHVRNESRKAFRSIHLSIGVPEIALSRL